MTPERVVLLAGRRVGLVSRNPKGRLSLRVGGDEGGVPPVKRRKLATGAVAAPRLRATLDLPRGLAADQVREIALADDRIQKYLEGAAIRKVIHVPDKLLSLVVTPS